MLKFYALNPFYVKGKNFGIWHAYFVKYSLRCDEKRNQSKPPLTADMQCVIVPLCAVGADLFRVDVLSIQAADVAAKQGLFACKILWRMSGWGAGVTASVSKVVVKAEPVSVAGQVYGDGRESGDQWV